MKDQLPLLPVPLVQNPLSHQPATPPTSPPAKPREGEQAQPSAPLQTSAKTFRARRGEPVVVKSQGGHFEAP